MTAILLYPLLTIIILFFLGYGVTSLLIPKYLRPFAFWLSPWFALIILIFSLTVISLFGYSVGQLTIPIITALTLINIYYLWKRKKYFQLNHEDVIILIFILGSILFNLSPLILQHKSLTSISLGNNDIIMYANVPDYLVTHSIKESFFSDVSLATRHVLRETYRWGPVVLSSFFLNIFHLQGYQFAYIFQVIIFSLTIPLVYVLLKIIYKPTILGLILSMSLTTFNVNLLYILYHDFFAQVLYWGLLICSYIFIFSYFDVIPKITNIKIFNLNDLIIGITFAVINYSFHEGLIFVLLPLILFLCIRFILQKNVRSYFISLVKIILIFILFSSNSLLNSIKVDFEQAFGEISKGPIGWQSFRANVQYPNPVEILGLYSIHSFEALPLIFAVIISLIIIVIILYGLRNSKSQLLLGCFLFVFLIFYVWMSMIRNHFFFYYRAITLTLPMIIILFTIGIIHLFRQQKKLLWFIIFIFILLEVFSAVKLNKRLLKEHLFVNASFTTLSKIPLRNTSSDPIFTEYRLNKVVTSVWNNNWTEYFLFKDKPPSIPPQKTNLFENNIPDNSLILISKPYYNQPTTKILLKSPIIWENQYYILGRLCNSAECLLNRPEDLSRITLGKDSFEDSLLISGWSAKESTNRWATGNESTLRLVTKDPGYSQLSFEAQALSEPQSITVYFDEKLLGTQSISTQWKQYTFSIPQGVSRDVHKIRFQYAYSYKPSEILKSQDTRDLAINFRWVEL